MYIRSLCIYIYIYIIFICNHVQIHLADFRSKYQAEALDLTELQAVWFALPSWDAAADPGQGSIGGQQEQAKAQWAAGLKSRLDEYAYKHACGKLAPHLVRNPVYAVSAP